MDILDNSETEMVAGGIQRNSGASNVCQTAELLNLAKTMSTSERVRSSKSLIRGAAYLSEAALTYFATRMKNLCLVEKQG